ncbi:MAG: hypothetical protein AB1641_21680 [Thermodesulfobacteriota bacterium]
MHDHDHDNHAHDAGVKQVFDLVDVESKAWSLGKLQEANTIFEPWDMDVGKHYTLLVVFLIEIIILSFLAFRLFS